MVHHIPERSDSGQWNLGGLRTAIESAVGLDLPIAQWAEEEGVGETEIGDRIHDAAERRLARTLRPRQLPPRTTAKAVWSVDPFRT